jgi:predicted transposase YdaD
MPTKKRPRASKKDQPHDAVFKVFFSDVKIAKDYLLHYTPPAVHTQIDFNVFQKSNTAFVSGRFGVSFCDVVYETRLMSGDSARLLFLFEHKSYLPSHPIYLQLLDYLLQIWEDDLKNKRKLSCIIPIVVYHGEQRWEQKPFTEYFPFLPRDWEMFVPNFYYLLTDLGSIPLQEIRDKIETEFLQNLFLALKFARNERLVIENWEKVLNFGSPLPEKDRDRILFQSLMLYFVNLFDMSNSKIQELKEQLPAQERGWVDGIPEIFGERWRKEGLREGLREGRQEKLALVKAFTIKTIQKFPDWSDAEVADFVGMTVEYVQQIRQELENTAS